MKKIKDILTPNYQCLTNQTSLEHVFEGCYTTDLLSQAIKNMNELNIFITSLAHENVIAVMMMLDLNCVIMTEKTNVSSSIIDRCNEENMCLITTTYKAHEVIIDLYQRGFI